MLLELQLKGCLAQIKHGVHACENPTYMSRLNTNTNSSVKNNAVLIVLRVLVRG